MATFELNRGGLILFNATLDADDAKSGVFDAQPSWKWSYRKRRSIHDRALPRETLITRLGSVDVGWLATQRQQTLGPLVAAPERFAQRS
ncbi:hypothetical protein HK44_012240 [Pseudomonas fluorescens HK44]|uniref:Uncharacterized protein n=1 Tax=Pseudomonas fluorescens HK44 TaxID=1042209 RepID=A0A010SH39_PSEFL|nr:hypothetical protein HK44_012240 [Pseudomonas fluorescens HK44]